MNYKKMDFENGELEKAQKVLKEVDKSGAEVPKLIKKSL